MRLLFLHRDLPPDSYTGVAIQVHRLANTLAGLGHEVHVRTLSERPADARYAVLPARGPLLAAAVRLAPPLKRLLYPLAFRFLDFRGYDAVHVHGDGGFLRYRGNFVRTFYGTAGMEARHARTWKGRLAQRLSYWMERSEARRCRLAAGISPHVADFLPGVTRVIPCMLPGDPDPASAGRAARTAHPSLLFLGSRGSRKRGELALELHRALRARFPSLTLTYVGPPAECAALRGTPDTEGVEFLSRLDQENLLGLYRRSWIYLCLSSYEGFGVGLIEAMACGCVAFTTPHPGADFLVRNGDNGLVAAPSEAGDVLARVLADAGEREAIAGRAMAEARKYSPRAVAGAYLELYRLAASPAAGKAAGAGAAKSSGKERRA